MLGTRACSRHYLPVWIDLGNLFESMEFYPELVHRISFVCGNLMKTFVTSDRFPTPTTIAKVRDAELRNSQRGLAMRMTKAALVLLVIVSAAMTSESILARSGGGGGGGGRGGGHGGMHGGGSHSGWHGGGRWHGGSHWHGSSFRFG